MKAARLTARIRQYSLIAALLSGGIGIACSAGLAQGTLSNTAQDAERGLVGNAPVDPAAVPGANSNAVNSSGANLATQNSASAPAIAAPADSTSPELQAAAERVSRANTQLDLARRRLNAYKAILRAAEAELKAAKSDQQAIALRDQAQKLANSSQLSQPASMANTEGTGSGSYTSFTSANSSQSTAALGQITPGQMASSGRIMSGQSGTGQFSNDNQNAENNERNFDFSGTAANSVSNSNQPGNPGYAQPSSAMPPGSGSPSLYKSVPEPGR